MKKVSLLAASVALALVGCGGSDGGSDTNTGTPSAGGIVITGFDGYFKNAVVFDDVNNNGVLDVNVDTVFGLTKADGKITLPKETKIQGSLALKTLKPGDTDKALATKLADLSPEADSYADFMNTYTTDMDHEGQPMANAVVFRTPISAEDKAAVISPLTDLVAIEMAKGTAENPVSEEAAIAAVTTALGGTTEQPIDLFSDFVKDADTNLESAKLHKTAQILTESKAKNPVEYEKNAAGIASTAKDHADTIVKEDNLESDELLNNKPVIDPSVPDKVITNYKLLVNEDAKIAIQKEISALAITEGQPLNTTITIPANLFQDKYDNTQTNVQAVVDINGKGEITANLEGETLTLSAENLQPTSDTYTITLKAEDKATADTEVLNTLSTTFSFKVEMLNTAPTVDTDTKVSIQDLVDSWKLQQGAAFSQTFSVDGLFDDREGDALTYTTNIDSVVSGLTSTFNKNTGKITISGNPQPKHLGQLVFTITADDGHPATRLASEAANFTLPAIEAGEITINTNAKAELQTKAAAWKLKVGTEFNQTLNINELFDSAVNGDVQYYANYAEHDNTLPENPINGVDVSVDQSGLVTLTGTPTKVTNGVILYLAKGINFSGGEDNDIESEMVMLTLPNVQPADEVTPPPTGKHPLENKNWYVLERGSDDGDGIDNNNYSRVWCDTYRFEDGIVYGSDRSIENRTKCSSDVTPMGATYSIKDKKLIVSEGYSYEVVSNADDIAAGAKTIVFREDTDAERYTYFAEKTDAEARIQVKSNDSYDKRFGYMYLPAEQDNTYDLGMVSFALVEDSQGYKAYMNFDVENKNFSCGTVNEFYGQFTLTGDDLSSHYIGGSCNTITNEEYDYASIYFNLSGIQDLTIGNVYSFVGKANDKNTEYVEGVKFSMEWTGTGDNE